MNKRFINSVLAAVLSASLLCGCYDMTQKTSVPTDPGTSDTVSTVRPNESSAQNSDTQPKSVSSYTSSDLPTGSGAGQQNGETSTSSGSASSSSSTPQSTSGSSAPQSASSSTTPRSSSSSTTPRSSSSSTTSRSSSSSSTPQSSSSSSTTEPVVEISEPPISSPSPDGSILNDYTSKWAYNHITDKQRRLYSRLYQTASSVGGYLDISDLGLTADDIYAAYWAFDYDNPQFLELGSGYKYNYTESNGVKNIVGISIDYGRTWVPQSDFDRITQGVLENARAMSSDHDKLKYIHDWIINNTVYKKVDTEYESEADGPVVYGTAICEGYSKAFMYFAQSLGFECVCAIGNAGGVDHMWNIVKLNGQWYHVDTTWDDPVMSDGSQTLRYNYFLLSDWEIGRDHSFSSPFTLPSAPYSYQ